MNGLGMKKRNKVIFSYMDIYYFARCLGKDKVPESGNNPLGMEACHFSKSRVDIHKSPHLVTQNGDHVFTSTPHPEHNHIGFFHSHNKSSNDMDSIQSVFSIDYTSKSLQPLNPRQRIKCLKDAGVEMVKDQLSADESKYLVKLRLERQQVGCKCSGSIQCDPVKCVCSREGIPCQSDNNTFPCKCGPNCANKSGKKVYSDFRIKYHYKHTFERDLFDEISENNMVRNNGECELCNEISNDSLEQMFATTITPKRKRITRKPEQIQLRKTKSEETIPKSVTTAIRSTVMTVSSPFVFCEPLISNHKSEMLFVEIENNKENFQLEDRIKSPEKVDELFSPLDFPSTNSATNVNGPGDNLSPFMLKSKDNIRECSLSPVKRFIPQSSIDTIYQNENKKIKLAPVTPNNEHVTNTDDSESKTKTIENIEPVSSRLNDSLWSDGEYSQGNMSSTLDDVFVNGEQAKDVLPIGIVAVERIIFNPISLAADISDQTSVDSEPSVRLTTEVIPVDMYRLSTSEARHTEVVDNEGSNGTSRSRSVSIERGKLSDDDSGGVELIRFVDISAIDECKDMGGGNHQDDAPPEL